MVQKEELEEVLKENEAVDRHPRDASDATLPWEDWKDRGQAWHSTPRARELPRENWSSSSQSDGRSDLTALVKS